MGEAMKKFIESACISTCFTMDDDGNERWEVWRSEFYDWILSEFSDRQSAEIMLRELRDNMERAGWTYAHGYRLNDQSFDIYYREAEKPELKDSFLERIES